MANGKAPHLDQTLQFISRGCKRGSIITADDTERLHPVATIKCKLMHIGFRNDRHSSLLIPRCGPPSKIHSAGTALARFAKLCPRQTRTRMTVTTIKNTITNTRLILVAEIILAILIGSI